LLFCNISKLTHLQIHSHLLLSNDSNNHDIHLSVQLIIQVHNPVTAYTMCHSSLLNTNLCSSVQAGCKSAEEQWHDICQI